MISELKTNILRLKITLCSSLRLHLIRNVRSVRKMWSALKLAAMKSVWTQLKSPPMYSYIFTEGIRAPCKSTNQHYYSYIEGKLNTGIIGHVEVCLWRMYIYMGHCLLGCPLTLFVIWRDMPSVQKPRSGWMWCANVHNRMLVVQKTKIGVDVKCQCTE